LKVIPPTVTGIVKVPFAAVNAVVTVNVTSGAVVPLFVTAAVIPVAPPVIVPTVAVCWTFPLYAITVVVAEPANAFVVPAAKVCASFVRRTVYASAPAGPVPPVDPVAPSNTLATVIVSATPVASAILTVIVFAVIAEPVIVTTLPVRETPAGTVAENAAPSTL
jgi:hypothetical protein